MTSGPAHSGADAVQALHSPGVLLICKVLLVSAVLLQKIGMYGIAANTAIVCMMPLVLFAAGYAKIVAGRSIGFALFATVVTFSLPLSSSGSLSTSSALLVVMSQSCLIFQFEMTLHDRKTLLSFYRNFVVLVAAIGVVQFFTQYTLGQQIAFFVDHFLPVSIQLTGFNNLNPLFYGSPIIKSNGVFFAEPSFFSQFLSVGLIAEFLMGPKLWRAATICAGLAVSFSGTGLLTLAVLLPIIIGMRGQLKVLVFLAIIVVLAILAKNFLPLDIFENRIGEFSDPNSSGYARFLSPFTLLDSYVFQDFRDMLIGRGPGSINEHMLESLYFGPTWTKLLYEYGILGFAVYISFFLICMRGGDPFMAMALSVTYFFMGGYLGDGNVIIQLGTIYVWTGGFKISERLTQRLVDSAPSAWRGLLRAPGR